MKKCSICHEWVDRFNGVTQYDDGAPVFICDCCFLQTEIGQELLANVTAAQQSVQRTCANCGADDWRYAIVPDTLEICNRCGASR